MSDPQHPIPAAQPMPTPRILTETELKAVAGGRYPSGAHERHIDVQSTSWMR